MHPSLVLVVTASAPVGTARYSRRWVVQIPGLQAEEPVLEHVACAAAYNTPGVSDDQDYRAAITSWWIPDDGRERTGGPAGRSPARDRWPGEGRLPPHRGDGPGRCPRGR